MRRSIVALAGLLLAAAAGAQGPSGDWRTITTDHYRVHYREELEAWSRRAAERLEGIHEAVSALVGYAPTRTIDVIVRDPAASSNGMAYPFLDRPYIVLWATPPASDSGIGYYDDWADLLVTHEVAHVVHLIRPRNQAPQWISRIFPLGPLTLRAPRWIIEGYATLVEGELTGSGRPASSWRALVLRRFAMEGKLPEYGALSTTDGWLGGSMAYLTGSAYLEWLQQRSGRESLPKLWRRLASRRGGSFEESFRAVFERSPEDLYDRFRAELTAAALAQEERLKAAGIAEGDIWMRLKGATWSPQVSPDGKRLLAQREPAPRKGYIAVWSIEPTEEERKAEEKRIEEEEELREDPEEIVDYRDPARPREPVHRLRRENGFTPYAPRWMPDSERVLFARNAPDADGVLRRDLHLWTPESGEIRRVTRDADVGEADPAPDGSWAAGVRTRYGATELVRVELPDGRIEPIDTEVTDPWAVWTDPRVSADGKTIAALLHRRGGWRLVVVPIAGGEVTEMELPGAPIGPPAWSADGHTLYAAADVEGIPEIVGITLKGTHVLTRTRGGGLLPAESPDGKSLFFVELTGKGMDIRRLALPAPEPSAMADRSAEWPLLPPAEMGASRLPSGAGAIAPATSYDVATTHLVRPISTFSVAPDGNAWTLGVGGNDLLDRLDWVAAGSIGNAAGPRGAYLAGAWRGLPVTLSAHLFTSLELPSRQELVPRPELDQERWGGFFEARWGRPYSWGRVSATAGTGWTLVEPRPSADELDRSLLSIGGRASFGRVVGETGWRVGAEAAAATGYTDDDSWSLFSGGVSAAGVLPIATLTVSGWAGTMGGDPTVFDFFTIGGAPSALLPPGLDPGRIHVAAMPAAVQLGDRFERLRADLKFAGVPIWLYGESLRAWLDASAKPESVDVIGAELRLTGSMFELDTPGALEITVGVGYVTSDTPRLDTTRGYAGFLYRP